MNTLIYTVFAVAATTILIFLLPTSPSVPAGVLDAIEYLTAIAVEFDDIFPILDLLSAVTLIITFHAVIFLWHGLRWVLNVMSGVRA